MSLLPVEVKVKRDWKSAIVSGGLIAAIVAAFIFTYTTWYNVPVMTYEVLPAYPVSSGEQIVAVIVRNEGSASATDVRIVIRAAGDVSVLPTVVQEEATIASENGSVVISMPRLPPSPQISLFLKIETDSATPITEVYVSSLQGLGKPRSQTPSQDPISQMKDILAWLGLMFVLILVGSYISSKRKKKT